MALGINICRKLWEATAGLAIVKRVVAPGYESPLRPAYSTTLARGGLKGGYVTVCRKEGRGRGGPVCVNTGSLGLIPFLDSFVVIRK